MLAGGAEPDADDVERFCGQARELFRSIRNDVTAETGR